MIKGQLMLSISSCTVAVFIGTKMDPNYVVVDLLLPVQEKNVVIYKKCFIPISVTKKQISHIKTFDEFQSDYPEYFL